MANDCLTFENQSASIPRLAIFKKSYNLPALGLIAWRIVAPSQGGICTVDVPADFEVYVSTGGEDDPTGGCRTKKVDLSTFTGRIKVLPRPVDDNTGYVPDIQRVTDGVVDNEIHISNSFSTGVWGHILLGGEDVYPPQIITPGETLMADVRPSFFVAHVSQFVRKGTRLVEAELTDKAVEMLPGQKLVVTGSRMNGFAFDVT
ncbi:hypothetical protein NR798_35955 [Archangium gephyra]|uniref:hypothetical protein n=1 Tax=Archangium gephyra TaxID=48 RepID=UPI0035D4628B